MSIATVGQALSLPRLLAQGFCQYHNRIQLIGYEVANLVLIVHHANAVGGGQSLEHVLAGLAFLTGSASIFWFDPERRPALLFFGGLALTAGGACLVAAGYPITGCAVVLASLETARGGLGALRAAIASRTRARRPVSQFAWWSLAVGEGVLRPYTLPLAALCYHFAALGAVIDRRPFLTSALIKFPLRLEMVVRSLAQGDLVSAGVALSWMILGDAALAFNDQKLNQQVQRWAR